MTTVQPAPLRVFLSRTSDLGEFPAERSFVDAARTAVTMAGEAIMTMEEFSLSGRSAAAVTREHIRRADMFVLIVGFRAGAPVVERPKRSTTELEYDIATESGMPRLVFLLDENTPIPASMVDPDQGRVQAFRRRLQAAEVVTATVSTPRELEASLYEALNRLPRPSAPVAPLQVEPGFTAGSSVPTPDPGHRPPPPRPPPIPTDVDTLAALLSPASRIEPELLRAVRVECLPELPVDAEQELWFGPLVDARSDGGITFAAEEVRELRARLRTLYDGDGRALVERAREVLDEVHDGISPLLRLEEKLAWHEVVGDEASAVEAADLAVRAVAARRDGAAHWVERVWPTLPEGVRATPTGWVLGQVAGARDLPGAPRTLADHEAAALLSAVPATRLLLRRRGGVLALGVAEDEADTSIDLPDTWPRVVEVTVGNATPRRMLIDGGTAAELEVGEAPVRLRTLAGDVYTVDDPRRELLDSVLLGPDGAWCVTRVERDAAVLATSGDLAGSLAAVGPVRAPVDLAPFLGQGLPGVLFTLPFGHDVPVSLPVGWSDVQATLSSKSDEPDDSEVPPGEPDPVGLLRYRIRAQAGFHSVVRTLARGPDGIGAVTAHTTEAVGGALVALEAPGADLVAGAPVVDDAGVLVGVVAPPSWSAGPAVVRMDVLAAALRQIGGDGPEPSGELLVVVDQETYASRTWPSRGPYGSPPESVRLPAGARQAVRTAELAWLLRIRGDGSAVLAQRMLSVTLAGNVLRRTVRLGDPETLPPNDASGLLRALGGGVGTVRLLDVDEARLVAAFVAGLHRPTAIPARGAATAGGRPAARVGDPTGHPGVLAPPGVPNVLLGGMPAAVVGTPHVCNFPPPAVHPPSTVMPPGSVTVLIGGMPAARIGDVCGCGAPIVTGSHTVFIGG